MNYTTNFVVNYDGHSELVKITPDVNFDMFWRMITALYNIPENLEIFLYAVPNDFSYPIYLTSHVYDSLVKATASVGGNNVIHLRILTPASFIFQVNPSHFGTYYGQDGHAIQGGKPQRKISQPKYKSITADVEGFYWEGHSEQVSDGGQMDDGEEGPSDPHEFVKRHTPAEGISASITLNPDMSTFELKDNKKNLNYAGRIQIKNLGQKKLLAMNWSLRQVLVKKSQVNNYPLPDLEPGQTYDLIFNLNLRQNTREVTYWSLCLLNTEGEETFFGNLLKAFLDDKQAKIQIIEAADIPALTSGLCPEKP